MANKPFNIEYLGMGREFAFAKEPTIWWYLISKSSIELKGVAKKIIKYKRKERSNEITIVGVVNAKTKVILKPTKNK
jgi:alpha-L-arabinofuranosidase